jgi:hypothetical protein
MYIRIIHHRMCTLYSRDVIELNDFCVWRSGEVQSGRWLWRQHFLGYMYAIAQKPFTESKRKRHRFFFLKSGLRRCNQLTHSLSSHSCSKKGSRGRRRQAALQVL